MWDALAMISVFIGLVALVGVIVGLVRGVIGKGWGLLVYSTVIFIVSFVLFRVAEEKEFATWLVLYASSLWIAVAAFICIIVGLLIGLARKRWKVLTYSTVIFIVSFVLFVVAEENGGAPSYTENVSVSAKSGASARKSNVVNSVNNCKDKFRARKNAVMALHSDGLLDAYGLSDIGVLNNYGISVEAAVSIADILDANGLYGLQNHYDEVAHSICAEVRHDEVLIRDGTREVYVNR